MKFLHPRTCILYNVIHRHTRTHALNQVEHKARELVRIAHEDRHSTAHRDLEHLSRALAGILSSCVCVIECIWTHTTDLTCVCWTRVHMYVYVHAYVYVYVYVHVYVYVCVCVCFCVRV